jgi:AcrR family transcriptional regulator
MPGRTKPASRLRDLIDAATAVFIAQGYRRTQMADVAEAMGVAKGTVYGYVESKEALFDLALRDATGRLPQIGALELPHPTPRPGATLREVEELLAEGGTMPSLTAALARHRVSDIRAEFEGIVRELYAVLSANRTAIKLVDRCSHDYPELARVWFGDGRQRELTRLASYLERRGQRQLLRPGPHVAVAARFIIETVTFWALHRFWDPAPQSLDDAIAEDTVVTLIVNAFVKE